MSRCLLHKSTLSDFKGWLDGQAILHRPPRGDYDVLQVQYRAPDWYCVFDRHDAPEHFTVDHRLVPLVCRFIKARKLK